MRYAILCRYYLLLWILSSFDLSCFAQTGIITTIAGGGTGLDGITATAASPYASNVATDALGNIYVAFNDNRIRKINTTGIITIIAGNGVAGFGGDGAAATAALIQPQNSSSCVCVDALGNVYLADYNNYRIRKVNTSGIISTIAGNGTSSFSGDGGAATNTGMTPSAVTVDAIGNIYFVDAGANHRLRKINTSGIVTTIAGNGTAGCTGDGWPATAASIDAYSVWSTSSLAVDGGGNVYFADGNNHRIRKINTLGYISTFAGNGSFTFGGDGGAATAASLTNPSGVATDAFGNVYIADFLNFRVRKVNSSGIISTFAGNGSSNYPISVSGAATAAAIGHINSIAVDPTGNLYMADGEFVYVGVGYIRKVILTGSISTILGSAAVSSGFMATAASFTSTGIAVDGSGNIFFVGQNSCIRKVNSAGIISTYAGNGVLGFTGDGGAATAASLNNPHNVAVDAIGNLYISDFNNCRVRKVNTAGIITTIMGAGLSSYFGDGGPASAATGGYIDAVATDAAGNIYIKDNSYYKVRKINSSGIISTIAGNGAGGFSGDGGLATMASVSQTGGGAADVSGNVYLSDNANNRIRKINSSGIISTFAGNGITGYSGDGSLATAAEMNNSDVAVDGMGSVYIADAGNFRIRKVNSTGIINTIAGNGVSGSTGDGGLATAAQLYEPNYNTIDAYGNVYINDYNKIRLVVDSLPQIIGSTMVCTGNTTILSNSVPGGSWSSSNTAITTVVSNSGIVTGVASGIATITYTLATHFVTTVITVNTSPAAITGTSSVCMSSNITLSDISAGGTWSSSATGVATIGATGIVSGVSAGTAIITYSLGCNAIFPVTVNASSGTITGPTSICTGNISTLANTASGGIWSSSATGIATVGSTTGIINGITAGNTTIDYTSSYGIVSTTITVNTTPTSITGITTICVGATSTLVSAPAGGTWSSSATGIGTIGSTTGILTGEAYGSATIYYTLNGCNTTTVVTINTTPSAISGPNSICMGSNYYYTNTIAGGIWNSSNTSVATINSFGQVLGVSAGTTLIIYGTGCGLASIITVTVNPLPSPIVGSTTVCNGGTITLTDATTGGTWSSSATGVATVSATTGIVTGIFGGTTIINYTTSCNSVSTTIINSSPAPITGTLLICATAVSTLSDIVSGGTWSSSASGIATVSSGGVVHGVPSTGGIVTISYTTVCGSATAAVSVNGPATITGPMVACLPGVITLSDAAVTGTWISLSISIATVGSTTGIVTSVANGVATIEYSNSCGISFAYITVNAVPAPIIGATNICTGASGSVTFTDAVTGGTWSSSATSVATVSYYGVVLGISSGITTITYSTGCGAPATLTVTVIASPAAIIGPGVVCAGNTITLSDAYSGGVWSSNATSVATVNSTTGVVSGVAAGTATIDYSTSCGSVIKVVTVNAVSAISGVTNLCLGGGSTTLTDGTLGGTWTSSASSIATIGATTGIITPVAVGTSTIDYTVGSCRATSIVTVSATPTAITGIPKVCIGSTRTLSNTVSGGVWSSTNTSIATVDASTGIVTGVYYGTSTISYTTSCGSATIIVTVYATPAPIAGTTTLCVGGTGTLIDTVPGGSWMVTGPGDVSIGYTTGIITGLIAGVTTINYTDFCGSSTITVTVNAAPTAITGTTTICTGGTIVLSDATLGGMWSSSATSIATIDATGNVLGLAGGTTTISYTNGCGTAATVTLIVADAPIGITGSASLCVGGTTTLFDASLGGTWSSSTTSIAIVGGSTGIVTGLASGVATITYSNGCGTAAAIAVTVSGSITPIIGSTTLCFGNTITLSDATTGGSWSSSTSSVATIGSTTGIVTGLGFGVTTIDYTTGCGSVSASISVNVAPTVITGITAICVGGSTTLGNSVTGGLWSSSVTTIATIDATGHVIGIAGGTTNITYSTGCGIPVTTTITVIAPPDAITGGTTTLCTGNTTTLADAVLGGTWSSSSTGVATIDAIGHVLGISNGITIITYSNGCGSPAVFSITVNSTPLSITGSDILCIGGTTTLTEATGGGTWNSSATGIATVGSTTGIVSGLSGGTAIITYSNGCGTPATISVTVIGSITSITGSTFLCAGNTITLSDATPGGTWSSGSTTIATIDGTTGIVNGLSAGITTIDYTISCGSVSATVTVNEAPSAIIGTFSLCEGSSCVLSDVVTGGTWSSSATSIATVDLSGTVYGIASGTVNITYATGCGTDAVQTITINALPAAITGIDSVCIGMTTTLNDATIGGSWSSSNTAIATVSGGIVTGITAGTVTITYTTVAGCTAVIPIRVKPHPCTVNLSEQSINNEVNIYPNPANEAIIVETEMGAYNMVTISNSIGQKLIQHQLNGTQTMINILSLTNGLYYITLTGKKGIYINKFVKL